MIETIDWGVLGCARVFRRRFLPALVETPAARLAAVGTRRPDEVRELLGASIRVHEGYEALLEDASVEAVYNPLPNALHAEWTIRALQAGKHVLCEKPLALDVDEARRMVEVARAAGLLLAEAFQYRYHERTVRAIECVRAGRLGAVRRIDVEFSYPMDLDAPNVRLDPDLGGGALADVGVYGIHFARHLLDAEPREVAGRAEVSSRFGIDVGFEGTLVFAGGVEARVRASFTRAFTCVARVTGEEATLEVPMVFKPDADPRLIIGSIVETSSSANPYRLQLGAFSDAIRHDGVVPCGGEDALRNTKVLAALYRSAAANGSPVAVGG